VLDTYAQEWDEVVRIRDAHANEVNELRSANRQLSAQVHLKIVYHNSMRIIAS